MLTKKLVSPSVGFDPQTLSYSCYIYVNILILCFGIPYWVQVEFISRLFWLGMIGSIINSFGLVSLQTALKYGPAGPVTALTGSSTVLFVIVEAIRKSKMLSLFELIAVVFGIYGALILAIPHILEKYCFFCCIKGEKVKDEED